jgi:hypothetical protein
MSDDEIERIASRVAEILLSELIADPIRFSCPESWKSPPEGVTLVDCSDDPNEPMYKWLKSMPRT